jgi:hypothetical protein
MDITIKPNARVKRAAAELAASVGSAPLDASTTAALQRYAKAIKSLVEPARKDIIEIGHLLTKAQESAGHGNWLQWLAREFDWSEQTARNYMRVYEMASIHNAIVDLDLPLRSLYLLAAPSTPEEARKEVIERVASGDKISYEQVKVAVGKTARGGKQSPAYSVPPSPTSDDIIDQIIDLFKSLSRSDQNRCSLRLRAIQRGGA